MKKLPEEVIQFFQNQGFVIVSTIDKDAGVHNSCKGILEIKPGGRIYLMDLYKGRTYENLKNDHHIGITAVDEHKFKGYFLKGTARMIHEEELDAELVKAWEDKITTRLTQRVLRNVSGEKGHPRHPEVFLPKPAYLIVTEIEEIIDLTPRHIKEKA